MKTLNLNMHMFDFAEIFFISQYSKSYNVIVSFDLILFRFKLSNELYGFVYLSFFHESYTL